MVFWKMINSQELNSQYAYVHIQRFIIYKIQAQDTCIYFTRIEVLQSVVDRNFILLTKITTPGWTSDILIKWKLLKGS